MGLKGVRSYYVYALKDKRTGRPFYIGKGTGSRARDHLIAQDDTRKGRKIREIGKDNVDIHIFLEDLDEYQALELEAQLIAAFGIEEQGGSLANSVIPKIPDQDVENINIPDGSVEKSQIGLKLIKDSVVDLLKANEDGLGNADIAKALRLQSDHMGRSKNFLTHSILGILINEGAIEKRGTKYFARS